MATQTYISDELTHFVGRALMPNDDEQYKLLLRILKERNLRKSDGSFGPGISTHSDSRKKPSTNEFITCTMLCFCDIPVSQLAVHIATPVHYVARNALHSAIGRDGPKTVGERFDRLHEKIQNLHDDLHAYVAGIDGRPAFLVGRSNGTTKGHQLLGQFSVLQSELEALVFGRLKFFTLGLAENDADNFYMEREWRLDDSYMFNLSDIARIILPQGYEQHLRRDLPDYLGIVHGI